MCLIGFVWVMNSMKDFEISRRTCSGATLSIVALDNSKEN